MDKINELDYLKILSRTVIHDLNNIVGVIYGALSIIKFEASDNHDLKVNEIKDGLKEIDIASKKASHLIEVLQSVIKKNSVVKSSSDLYDILNNVIKLQKASLKKNIDFKIIKRNSLALIEGNKPLLEILFQELLENAIDAIQQPTGIIEITLEQIDSDILITFSDSGDEFDEESKTQAFQLTYSGKNKEFGLGLPIASTIMRVHNGFIKLQNKDQNKYKVQLSFSIKTS